MVAESPPLHPSSLGRSGATAVAAPGRLWLDLDVGVDLCLVAAWRRGEEAVGGGHGELWGRVGRVFEMEKW